MRAKIRGRKHHVSVMALCEQNSVILRPGRLYVFEAVKGCENCERLVMPIDADTTIVSVFGKKGSK